MKQFLVIIFCLILTGQNAGASEFRFSSRPNKAGLVQWRTWAPETLEEARTKDRLILLSLSAVWCHWCHVMDETTYSNEEIIAYINEHFIPIRVDADMRPDIDSLYNQGGWPSTAILTPQGEVISGGTYIPPEEMLGRLKRAAELFDRDRETITSRIEELKAMKDLRSVPGNVLSRPEKADLEDIAQLIKGSFDEKNGGFGTSQKFPSPETIDFLLSLYVKNQDPEMRKIAIVTLDRMAQGKIFDKVEGGFFRYATKPDWSEPHYEKILEVNAGLIRSYAEADLAFGSKAYRRIVKRSVTYVETVLYDAGTGAFFGSQDADEAYYTKPAQQRRDAPSVDRTSYADSSSLMVSALVSAYAATGNKHYLEMAERGTEFIFQKLYGGKDGVYHFYRGAARHLAGQLSDNILFGSALLDLYNATGDRRYLKTAQEIGQLVADQYYDAATNRFRVSLGVPLVKPATAGVLAEVNGYLANYRALRFLSRLVYGEEPLNVMKIRDVSAAVLSGSYRRFSPYAAAYGNALLWILYDPVHVTIVADGAARRAYVAALTGVYVPEKIVTVLSLSGDAEQIRKLKYLNKESVYLCAGKRCSKPISQPGQLKATLRQFREGTVE